MSRTIAKARPYKSSNSASFSKKPVLLSDSDSDSDDSLFNYSPFHKKRSATTTAAAAPQAAPPLPSTTDMKETDDNTGSNEQKDGEKSKDLGTADEKKQMAVGGNEGELDNHGERSISSVLELAQQKVDQTQIKTWLLTKPSDLYWTKFKNVYYPCRECHRDEMHYTGLEEKYKYYDRNEKAFVQFLEDFEFGKRALVSRKLLVPYHGIGFRSDGVDGRKRGRKGRGGNARKKKRMSPCSATSTTTIEDTQESSVPKSEASIITKEIQDEKNNTKQNPIAATSSGTVASTAVTKENTCECNLPKSWCPEKLESLMKHYKKRRKKWTEVDFVAEKLFLQKILDVSIEKQLEKEKEEENQRKLTMQEIIPIEKEGPKSEKGSVGPCLTKDSIEKDNNDGVSITNDLQIVSQEIPTREELEEMERLNPTNNAKAEAQTVSSDGLLQTKQEGGSSSSTSDVEEFFDNRPNRKIERIRANDVIQYYHPTYRYRDDAGLRQATVISVDSRRHPVLELDNTDVLPKDTFVKRIKVWMRNKLIDNNEKGSFKEINDYKLLADSVSVIIGSGGKKQQACSGVVAEAKKLGAIVEKNKKDMIAKVKKSGLGDCTDMLAAFK